MQITIEVRDPAVAEAIADALMFEAEESEDTGFEFHADVLEDAANQVYRQIGRE